MIPFETNAPMAKLPKEMSWRVVVARAKPGIRMRAPIGLPVDTSNESPDDICRQLFEQAAPKQILEALTALSKKTEEN